jgi:WhiB family redox-sensing transcriptional regulator
MSLPALVDLPADMAGVVRFVRRYRSLESLEGDWRSRAACASPMVPPLAWFFPDTTNQLPGVRDLRRARRTCARCPVRPECRHTALHERLQGIWAGDTDADRRAVAHLPVPAAEARLEASFRAAALQGPWRVVSASEWLEADVG